MFTGYNPQVPVAGEIPTFFLAKPSFPQGGSLKAPTLAAPQTLRDRTVLKYADGGSQGPLWVENPQKTHRMAISGVTKCWFPSLIRKAMSKYMDNDNTSCGYDDVSLNFGLHTAQKACKPCYIYHQISNLRSVTEARAWSMKVSGYHDSQHLYWRSLRSPSPRLSLGFDMFGHEGKGKINRENSKKKSSSEGHGAAPALCHRSPHRPPEDTASGSRVAGTTLFRFAEWGFHQQQQCGNSPT
jgi:hypothetical protein